MYFNKHLIVLNKCLGMVMIVSIMFHGSLLFGEEEMSMLWMLSKDAMTLLILNKCLTENLGKNI